MKAVCLLTLVLVALCRAAPQSADETDFSRVYSDDVDIREPSWGHVFNIAKHVAKAALGRSPADENEDFSRIDDATNSDDFDVREPGWGSVARGILGRRSADEADFSRVDSDDVDIREPSWGHVFNIAKHVAKAALGRSPADENEDFSRIDDATNSDDFDVREPGWGSVARGILGRRSADEADFSRVDSDDVDIREPSWGHVFNIAKHVAKAALGRSPDEEEQSLDNSRVEDDSSDMYDASLREAKPSWGAIANFAKSAAKSAAKHLAKAAISAAREHLSSRSPSADPRPGLFGSIFRVAKGLAGRVYHHLTGKREANPLFFSSILKHVLPVVKTAGKAILNHYTSRAPLTEDAINASLRAARPEIEAASRRAAADMVASAMDSAQRSRRSANKSE